MSDWLICHLPRPSPAIRLVCFAHAGGGSTSFFPWSRLLDERIELHAAQLPGRERRRAESPVTNIEQVVESVVDATKPLTDCPCAFYGHSLGALLAFEVARRMSESVSVQPVSVPIHLFVAGRAAPQIPPRTNRAISGLPKEQFLRRLQDEYGALPEAIRTNGELLDLFEPILRADMTLLQNYRYLDAAPLTFPLTAYGGARDPSVRQELLEAWRVQTTRDFSMRMFEGDHFFVQPHLKSLVADISTKLRASVTG